MTGARATAILTLCAAATLHTPAAAAQRPTDAPETTLAAATASGAGIPLTASDVVLRVTNSVISSHDNGALPFMIIDKVGAEVFVFDADGQFKGKTPALLGSAKGDQSVPGVGDRELSQIKPDERTTPAGRFVARFGPAAGGKRVLWVDYATAVSMHPVITANKKEHRVERLKSPTPDDNRITYGCINVDPGFYKDVVRPLFTDAGGVVYILPEGQPS